LRFDALPPKSICDITNGNAAPAQVLVTGMFAHASPCARENQYSSPQQVFQAKKLLKLRLKSDLPPSNKTCHCHLLQYLILDGL
jgi:hypothetical protein